MKIPELRTKKVLLSAVLALLACGCGTPPALYRAAESGDIAQVNAILAAGGNPNEQAHPWGNRTALHMAAARSQVAAAKLLLEHGADPNIQAILPVPFHKPHNRGTALHYAACTGNVDMVRLLLAHGADPEPCIGECENPLPNGLLGRWESGTPLQLAEAHNQSGVVEILKAAISARTGAAVQNGVKNADEYGPLLGELLSGYQGDGKTIAITDFSYVDGRASSDGDVVAARMTTELIKMKKLKVLERNQIQKVLAELKLQNTGVVDPASAKELGKVLGADLLVVGSLDELPGKLLEVNLRLASVESGEAVSAASGQIRKDWLN
jgi:TolB-like protein